MKRRKRSRRHHGRPRASIAAVLARPAAALAYPGYRPPEGEHRTRTFLTGAALVHAAGIAVLLVLAAMAPQVHERILHLQILEPPPEPPPVVEPAPEPPPPPVKVEVPKPKPVPKPAPMPKPLPKPELPKPAPPPPPAPEPPPAPRPKPPIVKLDPIAAPQIEAPELPSAPRVARPMAERTSPVRVPTAQIDRTALRAELPDALPVIAEHRATATQSTRTARAIAPPAAPDRVAVPRPEAAPAPPPPRPAAAPAPARAARPALVVESGASVPKQTLRGVALSDLLPCVSDARELELKQRTVAAALNRPLCESPAGRFHFVETKNVNAFLMSIEQAAGRRTGDRCEELKLALDCLASHPPRSR
jgi:hypothetical protein